MSTATPTAPSTDQSFKTMEVLKTVDIAAPIEIAFEAILEELGPDAQLMDGTAYPFKLEAWTGGRWYRDLGNNAGHLWGYVQVIKPPTLLEIWGPLMMSYPAINHIQYRLTAEGSGTRLAFTHRGMGLILPQHSDGMPEGWGHWAGRIQQRAERKAAARK
ncbi:MAG: SRPBCC domain-containing protein [Planctomycetia bacterium]|nr:SRPBCC domain-containing protein [Planctomycetia bacterium]